MEIPEDQKEAREQAKKWREEAAKAGPDVRVDDGDVLEVGALHLRCLHTPGHTAGHLCILLEEEWRALRRRQRARRGHGAIAAADGDMAEYIRSLRKDAVGRRRAARSRGTGPWSRNRTARSRS